MNNPETIIRGIMHESVMSAVKKHVGTTDPEKVKSHFRHDENAAKKIVNLAKSMEEEVELNEGSRYLYGINHTGNNAHNEILRLAKTLGYKVTGRSGKNNTFKVYHGDRLITQISTDGGPAGNRRPIVDIHRHQMETDGFRGDQHTEDSIRRSQRGLNEQTEIELQEGNKSGDRSLHDWFTKSRSSDGKPGWVQLGGKYAGKPCAKQPGQTTKPKCGSSKMAATMSDKEENAAARRKRREDPNPDRSGKAKNVMTEELLLEKKDACYHKVKARYKIWPSAYASGALVKCRKVGAANWGNKSKVNEETLEEEKSAAWQRKEGKDPEGGLNKKGVESYRRENPGSKLQTAVTTKPSKLKPGSKAAKRRKSFCRRMKGMKAKLTSAKTARDPNSRINKSLRKWNC